MSLLGQEAGKQELLTAVESLEEVERPSGTTGLAVRRLSLGLGGPGGDPRTETREGMASAKALKQERAPHAQAMRPGTWMGAGALVGQGRGVSSVLRVLESTGESETRQWCDWLHC